MAPSITNAHLVHLVQFTCRDVRPFVRCNESRSTKIHHFCNRIHIPALLDLIHLHSCFCQKRHIALRQPLGIPVSYDLLLGQVQHLFLGHLSLVDQCSLDLLCLLSHGFLAPGHRLAPPWRSLRLHVAVVVITWRCHVGFRKLGTSRITVLRHASRIWNPVRPGGTSWKPKNLSQRLVVDRLLGQNMTKQFNSAAWYEANKRPRI